MGFFSKDKGADGSAFSKLAAHDSAIADAQGRIIALDAAHDAKHADIDFLQDEADRVHAESEALKARLNGVLATL